MSGRGPAPKDPARRRRTNKDPIPTTVVTPDSILRGPELPAGIDWPAQTLRWWVTWRMSPQAQGWGDTDWDFLLDTAMLHKAFWEGDAKVAGELRLRVAKFGATPEDRARLRMQIANPGDPEAPDGGSKKSQGGRYGHLRVAS